MYYIFINISTRFWEDSQGTVKEGRRRRRVLLGLTKKTKPFCKLFSNFFTSFEVKFPGILQGNEFYRKVKIRIQASMPGQSI